MSVFTDRITSTTNVKLVGKIVDTVLNSNVLATMVLPKAKAWSGDQMKFPIKYQNGVSGGSFTGFDTFSTTASTSRVNLTFDPKFYYKTVTLPLTEVAANKTDEGVMNLIASEFSLRAQEMADEIGTLFYSDGTGNSSKDFLGLSAIVDDGTNTATYGGLTRATYTSINSTVTASSGTLTLAKMATLWNAITSGMQKPKFGLTTEAIFSFYESLLSPMLRINETNPSSTKGLAGAAGFTSLKYKGLDIIADEKCTSGKLFFLNDDFIDFYALPMPETEKVPYDPSAIVGNDYSTSEVKGMGFSWSGWKKPVNAAAIVGQVFLGGQLIGTNGKRQGVLTGITSV